MLPRGIKVYNVSELTGVIKEILEGSFPSVFVEGEVSNFNRHFSGHWYFTLKDEKAQIPCVMFKHVASRMRFVPEQGSKIVVGGRISVYLQRGNYQVIAEYMEPKGLGALQRAFEQLKDRLDKEGLFDAAVKRPLPEFPETIAVITSPAGAAVRDILNVLGRRAPQVAVKLIPVKVQGDGSAEEIVEALAMANALKPALDIIILARGGGSFEDLWEFNEEIVARAIRASEVPVVTGVGHETDFTIADFAADLRAPTPSAAAELSARDRGELSGRIDALEAALARSAGFLLQDLEQEVAGLAKSLISPEARFSELSEDLASSLKRMRYAAGNAMFSKEKDMEALRLGLLLNSPARTVESTQMAVGDLRRMLGKNFELILAGAGAELSDATSKLNAMSPLAVLERGYSITYGGSPEAIIRDPSLLSPGDEMRTVLSKGRIKSRVEEVER